MKKERKGWNTVKNIPSRHTSNRSSLRSSIRSAKSNIRRRSRSLRKSVKKAAITRKRSLTPKKINKTSEVGVNTHEIYPVLSSIENTPRAGRKLERFPLKAYN